MLISILLEITNQGLKSQLVKNIPITPAGGSTWEPECEQETSFREEGQRTRHMKNYVKDLYQWLSEKWVRTSEVFHFDDFELRDGELYYKGKSNPLMHGKGKLRMVKEIKKILGKRRFRDLGFDVPKDNRKYKFSFYKRV